MPEQISEQKGKKRKSFEESEQTEVDKVLKTENKVDVGKIKTPISPEEITKNNKNTLKPLDITGKTEKVKNDDNVDKTASNTIYKPLRTQPRQNVKDENDCKYGVTPDDVSMRSASQDRSVKSMSPAVKARHAHTSRRKSPRSPSRSRHSRSSRRDRSRRDHHDRSREHRSSRRRDNKEKCRDYEGKICKLFFFNYKF